MNIDHYFDRSDIFTDIMDTDKEIKNNFNYNKKYVSNWIYSYKYLPMGKLNYTSTFDRMLAEGNFTTIMAVNNTGQPYTKLYNFETIDEQKELEEKNAELLKKDSGLKRQLYEQKTSFEETVVDYKPKYYTIAALPANVSLKDIKWITKT